MRVEREKEEERMHERKCECARKKKRNEMMNEATTRGEMRDKACKVPRDVIPCVRS